MIVATSRSSTPRIEGNAQRNRSCRRKEPVSDGRPGSRRRCSTWHQSCVCCCLHDGHHCCVTSTLASPTTTPSATAAPQATISVAPAPSTTASSTQSSQASVPSDDNESGGHFSAASPLIVLDPGHSGTSLTTIDPATQIRDEEYLNTPETRNMFDVAVLLKSRLEAAGYTVLMTKQAWNDTVCKRDRVNFANNNHAALGVSIHTSGHTFGGYGQIYVQRMDSYRKNVHGQRVYFALPDVAALSAQYGQIFLAERRKIEGSSVVITVNTSWGARGLARATFPSFSCSQGYPGSSMKLVCLGMRTTKTAMPRVCSTAS